VRLKYVRHNAYSTKLLRRTSSFEKQYECLVVKVDLEDALIPVKWAEAQISIVRERLLAWQRSNPYEIVVEPDPWQSDRELVVAYLKKPVDPLIIGDVGAVINSVRTALNLMMAAVVARHGTAPDRAPDFPIAKTPADFLSAVKKLKTKHSLSITETAVIENTKAYDGGDHVLWHIGKLDNLRKHQRLLFVEPIPTQADITHIYSVEKLMLHSHAQNKTTLYRIPAGVFRPTKGNTNLTAQIFLNETTVGIGVRPAIVGLRVYCSRVRSLILTFP
jgi:hypothetical protein